MFFFLMQTVYEGYSLEELTQVRDSLAAAGIRYAIRTINHGRPAIGNMAYRNLYEVRVKKSDVQQARYLLDGTRT